MNSKISFPFFILLGGLLLLSQNTSVFGDTLVPMQESNAYRQYVQRPRSELSKLIYLMDRFRDEDFKVLYDGNEYGASKALPYAKRYLAQNYKKNEKAESWLRKHAYRSSPGGKVIYFKLGNGSFRPLLDVLLEELKVLD